MLFNIGSKGMKARRFWAERTLYNCDGHGKWEGEINSANKRITILTTTET